MKILELVIRNFGKLTDRHIELSDGINLLYGENESGKSTVYTFIKGMLFGIERGRGRASVNDVYSIYEPWENPNYYSGKLKFESGGKTFWIDRNFDKYSKRAELFCEDDGEELSIEDGDLHMILGQLTEAVFENTVSIGQLKAEPSQPLGAELRNYAMNYYASGDGELDLDAALKQLRERKKEIDKSIKEEIEKKQIKREKIEQEASFIWREIHQLEEAQELLERQIAYRREHQPAPKEPENNRVTDLLRPEKWRIHPLEIAVFVAVIALAFVVVSKPWNYPVAIVVSLLCVIYTWNRMKVSKKKVKTEPERILEEITPEEEKIPLERLIWEFEHSKAELREKQIQYNNLREQLEDMNEMSELFWEQDRQKAAVDLAANKINELSAEYQKKMTNKLNEMISDIINEITDGKYSRLVVDDNFKISLIHDGRRISVEQLSRGTVEQLYFAMRMASAQILHREEQPVILDDTFVYYDDARLEATLKWLVKNRKQVIVFTCQKREEEILKKLEAVYRKVEI